MELKNNISDINPVSNPAEDNWLSRYVAEGVGKFNIAELNQNDFNKIEEVTVHNDHIVALPIRNEDLYSLIKLNCISESQVTEIPKEIRNLYNLRELDLSRSQLTDIRKEIGNLSNLINLNLSSNRLIEIPKELGRLSNLTSLNLSYNELVELPKDLGNLPALMVLYLNDNKLTEIPEWVDKLSYLRALSLGNNRITKKILYKPYFKEFF